MDIYLKSDEEIQKIVERDFKDHEATFVNFEGMKKLIWANPTNSNYRMEYLLSRNRLFVTGDMGEAVFVFSGSLELEEIAGFDVDFITENCTCSSREKKPFSYAVFGKKLEELKEELIEAYGVDEIEMHEDVFFKALEIAKDHEHQGQQVVGYALYQNEKVRNFIYNYSCEEMFELGIVKNLCFHHFFHGLRMVYKEIKN